MHTDERTLTDATLDTAVEAITIAITLGMPIPAIHGMRLWKAGFTSITDDNGYEIEMSGWASEEGVLARTRNSILPTLLCTYNDDYTARDSILNGRTLNDYVTNASTSELIANYECCFNTRFYSYSYLVSTMIETPLTLPELEVLIEEGWWS